MKPIEIYLEVGQKKTFAGALQWPGWSRSGQDETSACQALMDYRPRYAAAMKLGDMDFSAPDDLSLYHIVERLEGGSGTNYGVPEKAPSSDALAVDEKELQRLKSILTACWRALDQAVQSAAGRELRKGPRGGGRELDGLVRHVLEANGGYLAQISQKYELNESDGISRQIKHNLDGVLQGLDSAVHFGIAPGPRGGARWSPRYFARRAAWHVLDHAWELEDRIL